MSIKPRMGSISTRQARIAELARQMKGTALTSLSHHMDQTWFREAYRRTRKSGAAGVDGQTAREYAENLEVNLESLEQRAKSGMYRAPPVRRVHIPKGNGSETRPIGIPTFEDKVLQRAVVMALEPLYEQDFYDFSYGFRPGRSAHDALESLDKAIHGMLRAGVLEDGVLSYTETGTPQGGVVSPLLANIYLHEVIDRWWVEDVAPRMRGRVFLIRYADDIVMVFADKQDALRVQEVLPKRLGRFGLALNAAKTRLVRFRRPRPSGEGPEPGSFEFLGFTYYWGRSKRGRWTLKQKTAKKRFTKGIEALNRWMRRWRHLPVREQAAILGSKLQGHFNYYGIRNNSLALQRFHHEATRLWKKWLSRRSQRARMSWEKFERLLTHHPLPPPRLPRRWKQPRLANL